ncbi:MAG: response regulator [Chthoniobacterales bacterium]
MKPSRLKRITVVIIEDHRMFREQLAHLINQDDEMRVCGEADNVPDGIELIKGMQPAIAIVDISLKGSSGLELVKQLRSLEIEVPVLVLSMHEESLYAERALRAGANGYITKHEASADVMNAVRQVLSGDLYLNPRFMSRMMSKIMGGASGLSGEPTARLADRELDVFRLIGRGLTTREIGENLGLGMTTVDTYRARIKEKLKLENMARLRLEASRWVQEHG